jgi:hypothetical protein
MPFRESHIYFYVELFSGGGGGGEGEGTGRREGQVGGGGLGKVGGGAGHGSAQYCPVPIVRGVGESMREGEIYPDP